MTDGVIQTFRDLHAWQAAMDLTMSAYDLVKLLPANERFEMSGQIRRAAVSVPANVAEGQCCGKDGRYLNHIRIAQGSLGELDTLLELATRLGFIDERHRSDVEQQLKRTGQLLHGLARSVKRRRLARVTSGLALLAGLALGPALLILLG